MKKTAQILLAILWFGLLTLLTQTGGIVWLFSRGLSALLHRKFIFRFQKTLVFIVLYAVTTIAILPPLARQWGRAPLPVFSNTQLRPENLFSFRKSPTFAPLFSQTAPSVRMEHGHPPFVLVG